jgi:hypothetical protein
MVDRIVDQWIEVIKATHRLTVFPTARLMRSPWAKGFVDAISEFNRLAGKLSLGVKLEIGETPPDKDGLADGGADIQFDFAGGTPRFRFRGQDRSSDKPFSGVGVHGMTMPALQGGRLVKAFIFVPMFPLANDSRLVGTQVMKFIALHELIHAVSGLEDFDHSPESDPDVFIGLPNSQPTLDIGSDASGDRIHTSRNPQRDLFFISSRTARLVRAAWT